MTMSEHLELARRCEWYHTHIASLDQWPATTCVDIVTQVDITIYMCLTAHKPYTDGLRHPDGILNSDWSAA